jgi:hypothetical protein
MELARTDDRTEDHMTSTTAPGERNDTDEQTVIERATTVAADIGAQVHTAAADASAIVAGHAPAALAASRGTVEGVVANLRGRSDGSLALGTAFAAGLSGGMLLGRAPRLLVTLAFLATMLLGGTLLVRGTTGGETPSRGVRT